MWRSDLMQPSMKRSLGGQGNLPLSRGIQPLQQTLCPHAEVGGIHDEQLDSEGNPLPSPCLLVKLRASFAKPQTIWTASHLSLLSSLTVVNTVFHCNNIVKTHEEMLDLSWTITVHSIPSLPNSCLYFKKKQFRGLFPQLGSKSGAASNLWTWAHRFLNFQQEMAKKLHKWMI